ncbi:hypothetical protein N7481_011475 [Penicillium waksmanii]|uniref:uncharacterized protein n=1 Tax=Penicillium waksmanii TaxID=69791 RepID=UPI0025499DDA|nr:uncharacterized protein N7481_011475 [Penicillium waksmanii]KAJ5974265.1 hypothetical protein N7481_011475 [Penicillium waksmanii]
MPLLKWHNPWPGGIPSFIRRHEKPVEDVESATRAWRCFVREEWVDAEDTAAETSPNRTVSNSGPVIPRYNKGDIVEKFKFLQSVVRPDFLDMHMALDGTVLFADRAPN